MPQQLITWNDSQVLTDKKKKNHPVKVSLADVSRNFMTFIRVSVSGFYEFEPKSLSHRNTQRLLIAPTRRGAFTDSRNSHHTVLLLLQNFKDSRHCIRATGPSWSRGLLTSREPGVLYCRVKMWASQSGHMTAGALLRPARLWWNWGKDVQQQVGWWDRGDCSRWVSPSSDYCWRERKK